MQAQRGRTKGEWTVNNFSKCKSIGGNRKRLRRALLPVLITSILASTNTFAQEEGCEELEGTPPGLYATTDEGLTFLVQGDKTVELAPGEAAFANEGKLTCIQAIPKFLDWPCSTDAAQARKFATYSIDELSGNDIVEQVVNRYFEVPEVIEPIPNYVDGESSTDLSFGQIVPYSNPQYWYVPNPSVDILDPKRPKTLLISLYVGINQVVIDNYTVDALKKYYGDEKIPVVFVFNDSNVVPVSYFGANVSLEEIVKAFNERKIKLADVPMWPLGDSHFSTTAEEFRQNFDLPDVNGIDPLRREALAAQLETFGFSRKPVFVTLMEGGKMYIDDPQRVSVAISMGIERIPTVINFVESDAHLSRCGPGTPAGSGSISGATTPIGGAVVPPGASPPPPTEPNPPPPASDS